MSVSAVSFISFFLCFTEEKRQLFIKFFHSIQAT
jgi:hypothetical protein